MGPHGIGLVSSQQGDDWHGFWTASIMDWPTGFSWVWRCRWRSWQPLPPISLPAGPTWLGPVCRLCGAQLDGLERSLQLCWLNPCVWALSDDFSKFRIFRSVAYMRSDLAGGADRGLGRCPISAFGDTGKGRSARSFGTPRRAYRPVIAAAFAGLLGHSLTPPSPWSTTAIQIRP